jgi:Zn-dependent protease with chaperone function
MALPDGHIIFTDAMVELAEDDDELVSVFAHEIGHLAHKHVLRRVIQDSMLTLVIVLVTGDVNSASSIVIAIPSIMLELAYSREFEREADDFAFEFMRAHDLKPIHFARLMRRLSMSRIMGDDDEEQPQAKDAEVVESDYWSTHPATEERVQRFESPNI